MRSVFARRRQIKIDALEGVNGASPSEVLEKQKKFND